MNIPCAEQPADSVLAKVSTMQLVLGFTKVCSARTYANLEHRCYDWEKGGQITHNVCAFVIIIVLKS